MMMYAVNNTRRAAFALLVVLLGCSLGAFAQSPDEAYLRGCFVSQAGDSLPYRLLVPETVSTGEKYPLVLFMHGAGERGSDNEKQLTHGAQLWLNPVNRMEHPAYILMPQCPEEGYWAYDERPESFVPSLMPMLDEPTRMISAVMQLLDQIVSSQAVDTDRIYVMGLSMGGMATYDLAIRYPERFAAAVPICGTVNPERLDAAKDVRFRIYHGDNDQVVPVDGSRQAYRRLKAVGADVTYTEFPGVTHGSWNPAFTDRDLIPWLFSQKKVAN